MDVHDDPAQPGADPGARDRRGCRPGDGTVVPTDGGSDLLLVADHAAALAQVDHRLPDGPAVDSIGPATLHALFLDVLDRLVRIRSVRRGRPRRAGTRPPRSGVGGRGRAPGGLLLCSAPVRLSLPSKECGLAGWVVVVFVYGQLPHKILYPGILVPIGLTVLAILFDQPLVLLGQGARVLRSCLQKNVNNLPGPDQLEP